MKIGLAPAVFLVFLTLKLCGVIDWSWWWVTAPLWGAIALVPVIFAMAIIFVLVAHWCGVDVSKWSK